MTQIALTTATEPDGAPRLPVLDILRGVAILGILFMNISDMGGSLYAFFSGDARHLGWSGADQVAWWLREVLANGTARCLLEILFGAGMVILTDRAADRMGGWAVLRGYAWRNIVLFLFGLVHVFVLLWPGDILHSYALAALVAMGFRNLRPRLLLTIGLALATLQLVGVSASYFSLQLQRQAVARIEAKQASHQPLTASDRKMLAERAERRAKRAKDRADDAARVAAEDQARTGTALSWARALWGVFLQFEKNLSEIAVVWEAAGTMLIGAALYKLGVVQGARDRRFYVRLTLVCYLLGLGLRAWAAYADTRFDDRSSLSAAFGEYARLLTTLGHVGVVNLLAASVTGGRWVRPFEAAGRTALTVYILQTIVCLWVLYPPWGLGLYGRQGWAALMLMALAVNAGLLLLANWWVRRFSIAPVEWAWRSIIAGRALPFRKRKSGSATSSPLPA